jgi:hypothetical protein
VSASAETLLWLVNGADFTGALSAETEGDLVLVRLTETASVGGEILCEGIFDGTIENPATGGAGQDQITKVLTLSQVDVGEDGATLSGTGIACEVIKDVGNTTFCKLGAATVWPANLPWLTELELMASGEWLDLLLNGGKGEPGYEVECVSLLGFPVTDLCTGFTSALVLEVLETISPTVALGSHGEFNFEPPISSEEGNCNIAGNGVAALQGLGVTWAIEGELNRLETDVSETP